jgi:hypothetical protein
LIEFWSHPEPGSQEFTLGLGAYTELIKGLLGATLFLGADSYISYASHKYTDAGRDLGTKLTSSFIRHINSSDALEKQSIPDYKTLEGSLNFNIVL